MIIPSHNNSNNERNGRRQNWKANLERETPGQMDTTAAHTKFDKQAQAMIAANRVVTVSANETRVYVGAGKKFFTVYKIQGTFKCECNDKEVYGFCSHEKAAAAHAALLQTPASTEPTMICLTGREDELVAATGRADNSKLTVYPDFERDAFIVVNQDNKHEHQVTFLAAAGKLLASCSCEDFTRRSRICKHQAVVLRDFLLSILTKFASAPSFGGAPDLRYEMEPRPSAPLRPAATALKKPCGCRFNWDDKFWNYCGGHLAEAADCERHYEEVYA